MRQFKQLLQNIIQESGLNLNNISQASGISNAYLAKLSRGKINRPGKDKIASILLVLNYSIADINKVLSAYDYQPLHEDDIPAILKNNRARKIIGGNLPQYDHIHLDLLVVALERIGGNKVMVKNRPSGVFMPHELYLMKEYPHETNDGAALFRYNLTREILVERSEIFMANIRAGFTSDTYICRECLEDYLEHHIGPKAQAEMPKRTELVVRYFANALSLSMKRPKEHRIYIMERCPYFHFMIQDADGPTPKVSYPGRKLHVYDNEYDRRSLEGFTTDLPHILGHFRSEVERCHGAVPAAMRANLPDSFGAALCALFKAHNMEEKLKSYLAELMRCQEPCFY